MPSPQVVAREPSRRIKKSRKAERRAKQKVERDPLDDLPTPSQGSQKAGPGAGAGREAARRTNVRTPKTQGAKAHEKSHAAGMMDKGVGKRMAKQARRRVAGAADRNESAPLPSKQPTRKSGKAKAKAAPKPKPSRRSAAPAEASPTQRQILRGKPARKGKRRDEGVDAG